MKEYLHNYKKEVDEYLKKNKKIPVQQQVYDINQIIQKHDKDLRKRREK